MTKGEKLIWELFLWLREVMPATPENTKRQHEWAAAFHQMEHPDTPPPAAETPEPEPTPEPAIADDAEDPAEDPADDPHEHGTPARPRTRKKR